jgi:hypothetical protein
MRRFGERIGGRLGRIYRSFSRVLNHGDIASKLDITELKV